MFSSLGYSAGQEKLCIKLDWISSTQKLLIYFPLISKTLIPNVKICVLMVAGLNDRFMTRSNFVFILKKLFSPKRITKQSYLCWKQHKTDVFYTFTASHQLSSALHLFCFHVARFISENSCFCSFCDLETVRSNWSVRQFCRTVKFKKHLKMLDWTFSSPRLTAVSVLRCVLMSVLPGVVFSRLEVIPLVRIR